MIQLMVQLGILSYYINFRRKVTEKLLQYIKFSNLLLSKPFIKKSKWYSYMVDFSKEGFFNRPPLANGEGFEVVARFENLIYCNNFSSYVLRF